MDKISALAGDIRCDVIEMTYRAGAQGAHIGGSLSLCEIFAVLYGGVMRFDPKEPMAENRDRLILSKGHGVMAMYAALSLKGFIPREELWTYKANGTYVTAHPGVHPEKGVEFATGSLGQGLSLGVGVCLALKRKGNIDPRMFVIQGDGECDEGSVWEAAASAAHYKLDNLVSIVDCNHIQYDGFTSDVMDMGDIGEKWSSFGWEVRRVDGHDTAAL